MAFSSASIIWIQDFRTDLDSGKRCLRTFVSISSSRLANTETENTAGLPAREISLPQSATAPLGLH